MPELLLYTPKAGGKDAPDPSLGGSIRNIVKSAHKWGGDGAQPRFNKIKRVLMSKHPEVIAKAFGGDANKAAAWIKDNWRAMHGQNPWSWRKGGKHKGALHASQVTGQWYAPVSVDAFEQVELFCAVDDIELSGDLIYMPVCKTGTWKVSPLPSADPLVITKSLFDDVKTAFDAGAWEHVTVPLSHKDRVDENTGFVKDLVVRDDPTRQGEYKMYAGIKFTEPEIRTKVENGSIAGSSVGIALDGVTRTKDGTHFPRVLKHVALTNQPWLDGLNDGEDLAASHGSYEFDEPITDSELSDGLEPLLLALSRLDLDKVVPLAGTEASTDDGDEGGANDDEDEPTGIVWDTDEDWMAIEDALRTELNDYRYDDDTDSITVLEGTGDSDSISIGPKPGQPLVLQGVKDGNCLVKAGYGNTGQAWIAPYTYSEGDAEIGDPKTWTAVESGWFKASQQLEAAKKTVGDLSKGDVFTANGKKYKHAGSHPTKKTHIMAKPLSAGAAPLTAIVKTTQVSGPGTYGFSIVITDATSKRDLELRQFSAKKRKDLAGKGHAMPDGSFPIETPGDVANAVKLAGKADNPAAAKAHIKKRAKALGCADKLPDEWKSDMKAGHEPTEGGDNMPLELSQEEFDRVVNERVAAAITERDEQWEVRLSRSEKRAHDLEVDRIAAKLQEDGHAPAVIEFAREVMLADERGSDVLTLSRETEEDGEQEFKLSATDIVVNTLDRVKAAGALSLAKVQKDMPRVPRLVPDAAKGGGDNESLEDKTARLSKELHEGPVLAM